MSSERRLIAALDGFVRHRRGGVRSQKHRKPLIEFISAELRHRGVRDASIAYDVGLGYFYQRQVDLVVMDGERVAATIMLITQTGSVRKNLNNRRRDIVGDAVNMRAEHGDAAFGVLYFLTADEEATRKGVSGTSPIDELARFLTELQQPTSPLGRPLLDAAALISARQAEDGRIIIQEMPEDVDVLVGFFDSLLKG